MGISLADREAELMQVLWDKGPSTVTEVQAEVSDVLAYTTVLTILRKLEAKGYVGHTGEGRAHRYTTLVARDEARRSALDALSSKLFKGSSELLLTHLVADRRLSPEQIDRMRKLLARAKKEGKS
jgi:BlaI family penicillinase repressor